MVAAHPPTPHGQSRVQQPVSASRFRQAGRAGVARCCCCCCCCRGARTRRKTLSRSPGLGQVAASNRRPRSSAATHHRAQAERHGRLLLAVPAVPAHLAAQPAGDTCRSAVDQHHPIRWVSNDARQTEAHSVGHADRRGEDERRRKVAVAILTFRGSSSGPAPLGTQSRDFSLGQARSSLSSQHR